MSDQPEAFNAPTPPPPGPRGDAESRADVPRDHEGRYVTCDEYGGPPPKYKNGNPIGRTRASTIKNGATDKTGIINWSKMVVVKGLALDPALNAEAMKAAATDNKGALYAIAERAFKKGGGKEAADRGTAFHEVTERIKRGEQVSPDELDKRLVARDVDAYLQALAENNLRPVPGMQERVVILPNGAGGTFDDLFMYWNPLTEEWELLVGDTKSGNDIWRFGALEIKVQLWQYANAKALWLGPNQGSLKEFGEPIPMPPVRKDRAVVIHSKLDGTCEVTILDLSGIGAVVDAIMVLRRAQAEAMLGVHHIGKVDLREAPYVAPELAGELTPGERQLATTMGQILDTQILPDTCGVCGGPLVGYDGTGQCSTPGRHAEAQATTKTPQQLEDEATLARRQAVAAETLARAGAVSPAAYRITGDPDHPVEPVPPRDDAASVGQQIASSILDGEGKQLAPLAVPPAKGCSVCRRTGHRKGSKRCLGERDPGSEPASQTAELSEQGPGYGTAADMTAPSDQWLPTDQEILDATEPNAFAVVGSAVADLSGTWASNETKVTVIDSASAVSMTPPGDPTLINVAWHTEDVAPAPTGPFCAGHPGAHPGWTTRPDMPGLSVCGGCGLPTELHAQAMAKARAERQAPIPAHYESALTLLAAARSMSDVMAVRTTCIAKGQWSDEYEAAATARYFEVQAQSWPAQ